MNKLIVLLAVVVCVAVCNARVMHAEREYYDPYDGRAERGLYDLYEDLVGLRYPGDCKSETLRKYAKKCGFKVTAGARHYVVKDGNQQITVIPHKVKANSTCRSIIDVLEERCKDNFYDSNAAYDYNAAFDSHNDQEY